MQDLRIKDISVEIATEADSEVITGFLKDPNIDSSFVPALSDEARMLSIEDRVDRKMNSGAWIVANYEGGIVGCMAVIPGSLPDTVSRPIGSEISEGIDTPGWSSDNVWEVSTFVVAKEVEGRTRIKGIGSALLRQAKVWVSEENEHDRLIVDSWVGGELDGFLAAFHKKELELPNGIPLDTLLRIYTDVEKRGVDGPPTTVYGVPLSDRDINFFAAKKQEISELRKAYGRIYRGLSSKES